MTSPAAIAAMTYDGTDVQDLSVGIFLEIDTGLFEAPSVRGEDTVVPGMPGTYEGTRENDTLPITLRGHVSAASAVVTLNDSRASFYANVATVRNLFASNRPRANLVVVTPDGVTHTISARPTSLVWAVIVPGEYAEVVVSLAGNNDWTIT